MKKPVQFKPTKAEDVVDLEDLTYPLIGMTKYDGVYGLVREGKLLGRSLKAMGNKPITERLSREEYEGFVGELCYGKALNTQDLCRLTTSHTSSHNKEWVDGFTWVLFDYCHPDVIHLPYIERLEALQEVISSLGYNGTDGIWVAPYRLYREPHEVLHAYDCNLELGYEGLILRQPDGAWKNGRSTLKQQLFLRMKPQSDAEFVISGVVEAMQNNNEAKINELGHTERSSHQENKVGKGMIGAFLGIDLTSGKAITVGAGKLTHEERIQAFLNPPIGSIGKYRSMTSGVKDLPRFPRFYSYRNLSDLDDTLVSKAEKIIEEVLDSV